MKKALKIIGIVLVVLLLALVIAPYAFRGKLMELTKQEINKSLTAKVDFKGFGVSILKNFPDLTVTIKQLEIVGTEQFSNDTLIAVEKLLATVDIKSVISGDSIGVKQIEIIKPRIHALIAADSSANYDIVKSSDTDTVSEVDTSTTKFSMQLDKISIIDAFIYYGDIPGNMSATLDGMNMELQGNFTETTTLIKTVISVAKLSYTMDGIPYLKNVNCTLNANIDADFEAFKFTLKDNTMSLNDLDLEYNGWLAMPGDDIEMDFTCKTLKTDFKNILSLVPGVYMEGFENIKTSGKLALEASLKGVYSEKPETYPSFNIGLLVENGMFQYPDLPKSVDNINIDLRVSNPSNNLDSTVVDLIHLIDGEITGTTSWNETE
ncbi:MAG TPA: AsmA family protein, partial [Bacteroidales bacterium]|nr:AsmA family protein [Bacteroidales bacterium]